jgi:hypothetical protein
VRGAEALQVTAELREICLGEHPHFRIPSLDEQGTPAGIDIRSVIETGITPLINTGIADRKAGAGQIGAGVVLRHSPAPWRRFSSRYIPLSPSPSGRGLG